MEDVCAGRLASLRGGSRSRCKSNGQVREASQAHDRDVAPPGFPPKGQPNQRYGRYIDHKGLASQGLA
jgi:hypothetical protein